MRALRVVGAKGVPTYPSPSSPLNRLKEEKDRMKKSKEEMNAAIATMIIMTHRLGDDKKILDLFVSMPGRMAGELVVEIMKQYSSMTDFLDAFDANDEKGKDAILERMSNLTTEERDAILYSNKSTNRDGSGASDR